MGNNDHRDHCAHILHLRRGKRRETNRQNGNDAGKEGRRWERCWLFVLRTDVAVGGSRWSNHPEHIDNTGDHQRPETKVRWMSSWGSKAAFLFTLKLHQHRIPKQIKTPATIKQVNPKTPLSFLFCETTEPDVITSAWMSQVSALTFKIYSLERKR